MPMSVSCTVAVFAQELGRRQHYHVGAWAQAIKSFNHALHANPNDKLSQMYIDRCETLKKNPPTDWNGIFIMTTK